MRINRFLARAVGVSRREADDLVATGRVKIESEQAKIGSTVSEGDNVFLDGKKITLKKLDYIALNKPVGYVCSRRAQGDDKSIYELLPKELEHLNTVGRLDRDSSGLILLTNDGDFAQQYSHPRHQKDKLYVVQLNRVITDIDFDALNSGVELEDGKSLISAIKLGPKELKLTLHEGRNRQIRRTLLALGYKVTKLQRKKVGKFGLDGLQPAEYRQIRP